MILPQELLDAIIDEIRDAVTLQSCALVATSFVPLCQRKIYRSLYLWARQSRKPRISQEHWSLREAHRTFVESPHLGAYVHDLTIELPDAASKLAALEVLRLVPNIKRLLVDGRCMESWIVPPGAANAMFECLARPSLRRLHLMNVASAPSALIVAATLIPAVSLSNVTVHPGEDAHVAAQLHNATSVPRLRHLMLTGDGGPLLPICNILLRPRHPPYTRCIEQLELRMNASSREYDQRLLAACATTLEHLALYALRDPIALPHLPLVRRLEMKFFVGAKRRFPPSLSPTLSHVAASLPLVEHIALSFTITSHPKVIQTEWAADAEPLAIFGPSSLETGRRELRHLRSVHCRLLQILTPSDSLPALFSSFTKAVERGMPALEGTGILTCTLGDPPVPFIER
ncbi:hypothetical protein DFH07DRAFT_844731 [Mycena maculata]|uniref:Uncharacterized protein n=1 Tax=Mycena maculata TaxID=230809 RepID=A0AAD7MVW5_9AGAR|nr:hypothetical protein DFH07DRAFT_844731 [Mycena maculata]